MTLSEEIEPLKIYIGYDTREDIAYQVARQSILDNATVPVEIYPLKQKVLRNKELYWREEDKLASTEFTFTRFLVPELNEFKGWALFIDCDFVFLKDIRQLFAQIDDKYAVMCAHHDYTPKPGKKMDGKKQLLYPRKNWSSMVLYNCGHPSNKILTKELVNEEERTGAYFHRFSWLEDDEIGEISHEWNWLVGWYNEPEDGQPKALHYTEGGPWFSDYKDCEYANEWYKYEKSYLYAALEDQKKRVSSYRFRTIDTDELTYSKDYKKLFTAYVNRLVDQDKFVYDTHDDIEQLEKKIMGTKVAAIAPDPIDFNLESKGLEYDPYCKDFIIGAGGRISSWDREKTSDNALVIRGLGGTSQKALKHCMENNRDFYAIDTGYMQPGTKKEYHRVTKNGLQNLGPIVERPLDRVGRLNWKYRKFKKGSFVLVCPPSEKVMKFYGEDLDKWMDKTLKEIKSYTDRDIIVRAKPTRHERVTNDTIWQAMEGAHCLVTYNSIAATEALLYGIPAIALAPNAASVLCNTRISQIEHLTIPTKEEVTAFAAHLSYCQFTSFELRTGLAWDILNESS